MKNHNHYITNMLSIMLVIVLSLLIFGCNKEKDNDKNTPNDVILKQVNTIEEFNDGIKSDEVFALNNDLVISIQLLKLTNNVNIDLNGHNLTLIGNYLIDKYTINVKDSNGKGILDLSNFFFADNEALEMGIKYTMFSLSIKEDKLKISLDSYSEYSTLKNIVKENNNGLITISYTIENYVTKSQEEALGIESYMDNTRNGKSFDVSMPISLFSYGRELKEDATINISDDGRLVLSGDVKYTKGIITINCKNTNNIDISRFRVSEIASGHDNKIFKITGIDLNELTLPENTKIEGEYIIYTK